MNKKYISVALSTVASVAMIAPVFAQSTAPTNTTRGNRPMMYQRTDNDGRGFGYGQMMARPVITGTVTGVSGNTITLSGHLGMASSSAPQTLFTIDATNAKIVKNNATSTLTAIVSGDTILVQGTLTGTHIVATIIRDGVIANRDGVASNREEKTKTFRTLPVMQDNGQPIIAGTVSSINGNTLTITNKSNITYTIDVSTAKITTHNVASTITSVKVGDMVFIQGAVNGTSINASTLIDNGIQKKPTQNNQQKKGVLKGFFGNFGGFFTHFFGF